MKVNPMVQVPNKYLRTLVIRMWSLRLESLNIGYLDPLGRVSVVLATCVRNATLKKGYVRILCTMRVPRYALSQHNCRCRNRSTKTQTRLPVVEAPVPKLRLF